MKDVPKIIRGEIRKLRQDEMEMLKNKYDQDYYYEWVVTNPYICNWGNKTLTIPVGFLTDGATGVPDLGISWLFHDFLYSTHKFDDNIEIERKEADQLMYLILKLEKFRCYAFFFKIAVSLNPFWIFDKAWKSSLERGPRYYTSFN